MGAATGFGWAAGAASDSAAIAARANANVTFMMGRESYETETKAALGSGCSRTFSNPVSDFSVGPMAYG